MIKKSNATNSTQKNDSRSINYFKLEHVGKEGIACLILGVRVGENPASGDYRMKLKVRNDIFFWDVREKWPVSDKLVDLFGEDETKWENKQFFAFPEYDSWAGRDYIGVKAIPTKR